ncbi:MAG: hypothetical protein GX051_08585 [Clostridiales bacterium]|nr:hypothetical protein [Clostridiales bacterium]
MHNAIKSYKKVLLISSGAVVVGKSSEYDLAAVQACSALREDGAEIIVINPDPASIITCREIADHVYTEPLKTDVIKRIIQSEKPDALMAFTGGVHGFELAAELSQSGFLEDNEIDLLSIDPDTLYTIENNQSFNAFLNSISEPSIPSAVVGGVDAACVFADSIGYPVIVSPAYSENNSDKTLCYNIRELLDTASAYLDSLMIKQLLIEKSIKGYKEIEIQIISDAFGTSVILGNSECVDPVGISPGDSISVIPAQTVEEKELAMLKKAALRIVKALGIYGCFNVSFALKNNSDIYYPLGVDYGASRETALASSAVGYPVFYVCAKLALGYSLDGIKNAENGFDASREPVLEGCAVRAPKWSYDYFNPARRTLGFSMTSTGEVLGFGKDFCGAFVKAVSAINPEGKIAFLQRLSAKTDDELLNAVELMDDEHIFEIFELLKRGVSENTICAASDIHPFFISEMGRIAKDDEAFFDSASIKYYKNREHSGEKNILVIGPGATTVEYGTDYDFAAYNCLKTLSRQGLGTIYVNNNPAAVSVDSSAADITVFEPSNDRQLEKITEKFAPDMAVVQFGGAKCLDKSKILEKHGVKILGADANVYKRMVTQIALKQLLKKISVPYSDKVGKSMGCYVITDGKDCLVPGIYEHIERSSVNPADAICVYPSVSLTQRQKLQIYDYAVKIALELGYKGICNIRFVCVNNEFFVSEITPNHCRNIPFITKASGLPVTDIAVRCMLGETLTEIDCGIGLVEKRGLYSVKVPVFSFENFADTDIQLTEEMKSTGEVLGIAYSFEDALLKALIASGMRIKRSGGVFVSVKDYDKQDVIPVADKLSSLGFSMFATANTAKMLNSEFIATNSVKKIHEGEPNTLMLIKSNRIVYVISTSPLNDNKAITDDIIIRRTALKRKIPTFTSVDTAAALAACLERKRTLDELPLFDVNNL